MRRLSYLGVLLDDPDDVVEDGEEVGLELGGGDPGGLLGDGVDLLATAVVVDVGLVPGDGGAGFDLGDGGSTGCGVAVRG